MEKVFFSEYMKQGTDRFYADFCLHSFDLTKN